MAGRPVPYVLPNIVDRTFFPAEPNRDIGRFLIWTPLVATSTQVYIIERLRPATGRNVGHTRVYPDHRVNQPRMWPAGVPPPRPQNDGVSASRDQAGMAPADAPEAPCRRSVSPSCRAVSGDDQRPFDRLRCRLAGADFLDVFAAARFFNAATASAGAGSGNATAWEMISPAPAPARLPNLMKRNAAAFCASNPRRAAVKVRASQGSIGVLQ